MTHDPIPERLMAKIRVMSECDDVRVIPGCSHYAVTPEGQVWSVAPRATSTQLAKVPRRLKTKWHKGIPFVCLAADDGTIKTYSLLKCVALAFIGEPPNPDDWASPLDKNPAHISPDNVVWISHSEATRRGVIINGGPFTYGDDFGERNRLTAEKVAAMRQAYEAGETAATIAQNYGVNRRTAERAINGNAWKQTDTPLPTHRNYVRGENVKLAKLTEQNVREIKRLLANGESLSSVARRFHVDVSTIFNIKHGKTWTHVEV